MTLAARAPRWAAIAAARRADLAARLPWCVALPGAPGASAWVGSVPRQALPALLARAQALQAGALGQPAADAPLLLTLPAAERTPFLAALNQALRAEGLIRAWRDEAYGLYPLQGLDPAAEHPGEPLAVVERASARFWGTLTFGAHANGYVAGPDGRPEALWIARRSDTKPTDPGMLDNLIGGGVPLGQTPREALLREGWEEAGLRPAQMQAITRGRRLALCCDVREGLQREWLSVYDLALPAGLTPVNQDGEVQALQLLPVAQALALAADGAMTVDATLATLDFALRHGLLGDGPAAAPTPAAGDSPTGLAAALAPLCLPAEPAAVFAFNQSETPGQPP